MKPFKIILSFTVAVMFLTVVPKKANSQIISSVKAVASKDSTITSSTADTTYFTLPAESITRSYHVFATLLSGSLASNKIFFRGLGLDGTTYKTLDSLALSSTAMDKLFVPAGYTSNQLAYTSYQFYILSPTGTSKIRYKAFALRRN